MKTLWKGGEVELLGKCIEYINVGVYLDKTDIKYVEK